MRGHARDMRLLPMMLEWLLLGAGFFHRHDTPEGWASPPLPACGIFDVFPQLQ